MNNDFLPPPDPGEPLPAYEIEAPKTWKDRAGEIARSWKFWVVAILAIGLTIGLWKGPGIYREAKAQRALAFMQKGDDALAAREIREAIQFYRQGQMLAPGDERIQRWSLKASAATGNTEAFDSLREKIGEGTMTADEAMVIAEQSVKRGDAASATAALAKLPDSLPPSLTVRRMAAESALLVNEGKTQEAVAAIEQAITSLPETEANALRLILIELLLRPGSTDQEKAAALVGSLSKQPAKEGLLALRLAAAARLSQSALELLPTTALPAMLREHPEKELGDDLLAVQLEAAASPSDIPAILAQLIASKKSEPLAIRIKTANWLAANGAHAQGLELISLEDAQSDTDAFLVRMECLSGLKRWQDARAELDAARDRIISYPVRHLFIARCAEELANPAAASESWDIVRRNIRMANPKETLFIATQAEARGQKIVAAAAYRALSTSSEGSLQGLKGMLRTLPLDTPISEVREIYASLVAARPDDQDAAAGRLYFDLLDGVNPQKAVAEAAALQARDRASLAYASIHALALLRNGRPADALAIVENPDLDWATAQDRWKAVRAAALRANQKTDDDFLRSIQRQNLRSEELDLLTNPTGRVPAGPK